MTGLCKEISHSLFYMTEGQQAETAERQRALAKRMRYSAKCRLKDKKTHSILCHIFLAKEFVYQICRNTVYLVAFSYRKY
jgi:hypothetical protein